ncbi:GH39 family glycosyl hydrolase [Saccharicrinis sp. 156]|uniref:GH39 family glycosyl hydrolase n=1 Tax=Saccharicrinis sp. 156 TaxID=3417574 RepID=UPI003D354085
MENVQKDLLPGKRITILPTNNCSRQIFRVLPVIVFLSMFLSCSKDSGDDNFKLPETPDTSDKEQIDPNKIVNINTESVVGEMYNFWSTRPMVNQTRFTSSNFTGGLESIKTYVKSYNLVRVLGGRTDGLNNFYKGVDTNGNIITDFSGLISSMQGFMQTGFKPRIVLDNVPWEMNAVREENKYGNTNPPDDYIVWRQYINAFLNVLIDEFTYDEVKTWRFRVATEPNYVPEHWNGTKEEFFKHYDITVDEVLKVIPDAIIGPGNLLTEGAAEWRTEIIDHCANGTNYATGEIGTRMSFFCLSYYEKIDQNTINFPETVEPYRTKLNSYAQFADIPFDIQEFGILRDEYGNRGLSLSDATELGASWYATIADMAYKYKITEIYDWGQESTDALATGRRNVTSMFLKMVNGNRLAATHNMSGHVGTIPAIKDGKIYLLIYNHNTTRTSTAKKSIYPKIEGTQIGSTTHWEMNEWTVDKDHGIFMHELYKDVKVAGVSNKTGSSARIYGNRPDDYFNTGWEDIFNANKSKYTELAKLPQTINDSIVGKAEDGSLTLKVDLGPHSVKLIELIPQ